jgi:hypothetical protein
MRARLIVGFLVMTVPLSAEALADDKAVCLDASLKGQTLRDAHKLVEAREQFRTCAQQQCPAAVQRDCANWLDAVEKGLPTVVLTAKDATGASIVEVKVSLDGAPFATRLAGEAVPVNPGMHTFRFDFADGAHVEQQALVREGAQDQVVAAAEPPRLAAPPASAPPASPAAAPAMSQEAPRAPDIAPESAPRPPSRVPSFLALGVGAAGVAVGSVAGILAMSAASGAKSHCQGTTCTPDAQSGIDNSKTLALVSDVGFLVGAAGAAFGLGLLLSAPSAPSSTATTALKLVVGPATVGFSGVLP